MQDGDKRGLLAVFDSMLAQLAAHLDRALTAAMDKLQDLLVQIRTSGMQEVRGRLCNPDRHRPFRFPACSQCLHPAVGVASAMSLVCHKVEVHTENCLLISKSDDMKPSTDNS